MGIFGLFVTLFGFLSLLGFLGLSGPFWAFLGLFNIFGLFFGFYRPSFTCLFTSFLTNCSLREFEFQMIEDTVVHQFCWKLVILDRCPFGVLFLAMLKLIGGKWSLKHTKCQQYKVQQLELCSKEMQYSIFLWTPQFGPYICFVQFENKRTTGKTQDP